MPTLVSANLVRSSGVPAFTSHYLIGMLSRDGISSETEIFVSNGHQTIPLSGSIELEPGDLPATCSSPLIQISTTSTVQHITTEPVPTDITDIHALHDNIPVANDEPPHTETPPT